MNDAMRQGRMTGRGKDKGTGSSAEGEARWSVIGDDLSNSIVIVNLTWRLTGMLSQFNRSGLVQDIVRRLATTFSANLDAALNGQEPVQRSAHSLSVIGLLWAVIRSRLFPRS
jgi:carbon-monoxide dehydrogenase small subunit